VNPNPTRVAYRFIEAMAVGFHGWRMSPESMRMPGPHFTDKKPIPAEDIIEAVDYLEEARPGVLVAYSRGAAVAMLALKELGAKPKVIWVAPAWRRGWGKAPPPLTDGVILHGDQDSSVPLQHSCDLAEQSGLPLRVLPGRNHVNILKDKTNPGAGIPVPPAKVQECSEELPDWGTSGQGSPDDIEEQQAFTRSLQARVASRWLQRQP
jgi:hypothetical protein